MLIWLTQWDSDASAEKSYVLVNTNQIAKATHNPQRTRITFSGGNEIYVVESLQEIQELEMKAIKGEIVRV